MSPIGLAIAAYTEFGCQGSSASNDESAELSDFVHHAGKVGVSSCGISEVYKHSGSTTLGQVAEFKLDAGVDAHSGVCFSAELSGADAVGDYDKWAGVSFISKFEIRVGGNSNWETLDTSAWLHRIYTETSGGEYEDAVTGLLGAVGGTGITVAPQFIGGQVKCCVQDTKHAFLLAAANSQAIYLKFTFATQAAFTSGANPGVTLNNFKVYTQQSIMMNAERDSARSTDIVRHQPMTEYTQVVQSGAVGTGSSVNFILDHVNLYTSYITVAVRKAGATAGTYTDCLDDLEISFNGNSNGVLSREVSLYSVSSMIGLPNGGSAGKNNIYIVPIASQWFGTGSAIPCNRVDQIRLKSTITGTALGAGDIIEITCHGSACAVYTNGAVIQQK